MAHATTPHTQTQQNRTPNQTDLEPDQLEQTAGTGAEAELYNRREGAQSGSNRGPHSNPASPGQPKTEQPAGAFEGSVTTRTPGGRGRESAPIPRTKKNRASRRSSRAARTPRPA